MLILEIRSKVVNPAAIKLFVYCPIFMESSQSPTVTNKGYSGTSPGDSGILQGKTKTTLRDHLKPDKVKNTQISFLPFTIFLLLMFLILHLKKYLLFHSSLISLFYLVSYVCQFLLSFSALCHYWVSFLTYLKKTHILLTSLYFFPLHKTMF